MPDDASPRSGARHFLTAVLPPPTRAFCSQLESIGVAQMRLKQRDRALRHVRMDARRSIPSTDSLMSKASVDNVHDLAGLRFDQHGATVDHDVLIPGRQRVFGKFARLENVRYDRSDDQFKI